MAEQATVSGFRLSPQQERVWELQQEAAEQVCYGTQCELLLEGELEAERLERAIKEVVQQHEILRTKYRRLPEMKIPVQVIEAQGKVRFEQGELQGKSEAEQQAEISRLYEAVRQGIGKNGAGLHVQVMKAGAGSSVVVLSTAAMNLDAIGMKNLVEKISRRYESETGADSPLQYADLSEWQHDLLESEDMEQGREFWRAQEKTAGGIKLPRGEGAGEGLAYVKLRLGQVLSRRVAELAQEQQSSGERLLLACWQTLLCRLSGQTEIVVGVASAGRNYEGLGEALGLFGKYLPLRMQMTGGKEFLQLWQESSAAVAEMEKWQEYYRWNGNGEQELSAGIVVGYEYLELPAAVQRGGVSWRIRALYSCYERQQLKLVCIREEEELVVELHYERGVMSEAGARRMLAQYEQVVRSVSADVRVELARVEVLSEAERKQLLEEWNDTEDVDYASAKCLHELFEEQVARTPAAVAV
ncbi:MAG TPA: condensation domain-containing protein, partial [Pyrinomonadaceae bacterium]